MRIFEVLQPIFERGFNAGPVAIAVLGAPASGKSYVKGLITRLASQHDAKLSSALSQGTDVTVDILRGKIQDKDPVTQLKQFYLAFLHIQQLASKDPVYSKWYSDVKNLWSKVDDLSDAITTSLEGNTLVVNGGRTQSQVLSSLGKLPPQEAANIVKGLNSYNDYKRVVRWLQSALVSKAQRKQKDIVFDEVGDEADKIISRFETLRSQQGNEFITSIFMLHGETPVTNLIQNAYRMVSGGDGGRDSSGAIIQAWLDVQKNISTYQSASEKYLEIDGTEDSIMKAFKLLQQSNTDDNTREKNIDVFIEIRTRNPGDAYRDYTKKLSKDQLAVDFLNAILLYQVDKIPGLSDVPGTKELVTSLVGNKLGGRSVKQVLQQVKDSGRFDHPLNNLDKMLASA